MVDGTMDAVRCLSCGETRWTLFSGSLENLLAELSANGLVTRSV